MADKKYFDFNGSKTDREFELHRSIHDEAIEMFGIDCHYIPRSIEDVNLVFNEDTMSSFRDSHIIRVYVDSYDGWEGQGDLYSKFGIELTDETTVRIERKRFNSIIGTYPKEGDLLFFPLAKSLMEVRHVEEDVTPYFAFQRPMVYILRLSMFKYSGEEMNTGIDVVDDIDRNIGDQTFPNDEINDAEADVIDFTIDSPFGEFGG